MTDAASADAVPTPYYEDGMVTLFQGPCEEMLRALPENSVHAVICDPPYGMSKEPDMVEVLKHWLAGDDYVHKGSGFMGHSWDSFVPGPSVWREIYRVLKPGGMLAAFASTRTADLMGIAIRLAGFERRDTILHVSSEVCAVDDVELAWFYGSGFPKEGDLGLMVDEHLGHVPGEVTRMVERGYEEGKGFSLLDEYVVEEATATRTSGISAAYQAAEGEAWKANAGQQTVVEREPVSEEGKRWRGWSSTLKPANEPIILARKPLAEKNIPANLLAHEVGAYNISGAAIGSGRRFNPASGFTGDKDAPLPVSRPDYAGAFREGRWPPNVVVSHAEGCRRVGETKQKAQTEMAIGPTSRPGSATSGTVRLAHVGEDGTEVIEAWACVEGCQVAEMDRQGSAEVARLQARGVQDVGMLQGVSRFFYCAKPTRNEKDAGISGEAQYLPNLAGGSGVTKLREFQALVEAAAQAGMSVEAAEAAAEEEMRERWRGAKNTHLTVKPIDLMRWLIRLLCPPGGRVLDPFMGSGTTGCAAVLEPGDFRFVGVELSPEHARQARERIVHWQAVAEAERRQLTLFDSPPQHAVPES